MQKIIIVTSHEVVYRNMAEFLKRTNLNNQLIQVNNKEEIIKEANPKDIVVIFETLLLANILQEANILKDLHTIAVVENTNNVTSNIKSICIMPLDLSELLAKIKMYLNNQQSINNKTAINNFELSLTYDQAKVADIKNNTEVIFTEKEGLILQMLFQSYPNGSSKVDLLKSIWGYDSQDSKVLESHISNIRKKLSENNILLELQLDKKDYKLISTKP